MNKGISWSVSSRRMVFSFRASRCLRFYWINEEQCGWTPAPQPLSPPAPGKPDSDPSDSQKCGGIPTLLPELWGQSKHQKLIRVNSIQNRRRGSFEGSNLFLDNKDPLKNFPSVSASFSCFLQIFPPLSVFSFSAWGAYGESTENKAVLSVCSTTTVWGAGLW